MSFGILNLQPPSSGITPLVIDTNGYQASVDVQSGAIVYTGYNLAFTPKKTGMIKIILHIAISNDPTFSNATPGIAIVTAPQSNGTQLIASNPPVLAYTQGQPVYPVAYTFIPDPPAIIAGGPTPPNMAVLDIDIVGLTVGTTYYLAATLVSNSTSTVTENIQIFKAIIIEY